jgi:hypothetical protein
MLFLAQAFHHRNTWCWIRLNTTAMRFTTDAHPIASRKHEKDWFHCRLIHLDLASFKYSLAEAAS